jgi:hypothetical protein
VTIASLRVPAIITCSIISLVVGLGGGAGAMTYFGYHWKPEITVPPPPAGMPAAPTGIGGAKSGPSAKSQLAQLLVKLDQVTGHQLVVNLTSEQKKALREQLAGLGDPDELKDDDAKKRLDAILETVKSHKETMELAGFRWPGPPAGGMSMGSAPKKEAPNPFKEGDNAKRLQELQKLVGKE